MIVQGANGELEGAKGLLFAVVTKVETVHVDDLILLMNKTVCYNSNSPDAIEKISQVTVIGAKV